MADKGTVTVVYGYDISEEARANSMGRFKEAEAIVEEVKKQVKLGEDIKLDTYITISDSVYISFRTVKSVRKHNVVQRNAKTTRELKKAKEIILSKVADKEPSFF
jgi:hypothetical protein